MWSRVAAHHHTEINMDSTTHMDMDFLETRFLMLMIVVTRGWSDHRRPGESTRWDGITAAGNVHGVTSG